MSDIENRISFLKSKLEEKKNEKTRAEASLEMAETQLQDVTKKITDLGYAPENLADEIKSLDSIVNVNLAEAERILADMEKVPEKEAAAL